jgi:hypothetical protein
MKLIKGEKQFHKKWQGFFEAKALEPAVGYVLEGFRQREASETEHCACVHLG